MRKRWVKALPALLLALALGGCASNPAPPAPTPSPENTGTPSTGQLKFQLIGADGNDNAYDQKLVVPIADSPLKGKVIYWLGSSVTYGSGSNGQSMARFMAAADGVTSVVEAVSGTTLATLPESGENSYVSRMLNG